MNESQVASNNLWAAAQFRQFYFLTNFFNCLQKSIDYTQTYARIDRNFPEVNHRKFEQLLLRQLRPA